MVAATERTNYPLAMAVDDSGTNFQLTALAHPLAVPDRVCGYLQQALTGLVNLLEREPHAPIRSVSVLPQAERQMVVEEWNRTDATLEQGTLDGLFSAQVRRTPNALAVVGRDGGIEGGRWGLAALNGVEHGNREIWIDPGLRRDSADSRPRVRTG